MLLPTNAFFAQNDSKLLLKWIGALGHQSIFAQIGTKLALKWIGAPAHQSIFAQIGTKLALKWIGAPTDQSMHQSTITRQNVKLTRETTHILPKVASCHISFTFNRNMIPL